MAGSKDCCSAVVVDIDCKNSKDGTSYPSNVPKPKNGCEKVNSGSRLSGDKVKRFRDYYDQAGNQPLAADKAKAISDSLGSTNTII